MNDYKRIGDYIREVNVRNRELRVTNLMGISMTKKFRPSTSNVVGTDLSNYKIVSKNIFVFDTMSVIRVHKVPIAINNTDEPIIVSPAYHTFEVIDKNTLMPEYLMMWFCRPEFDRYADFKSDSAIRGGYGWDELCDTIIDVPTLARQREIVAEYETLTRRIRLNEQMIAKLEETAQALYRKMFVDGIDKENLPEGWRRGKLGEVAVIKAGGDKPKEFSEKKTDIYNIPVYANGIENKGIFGYTSKPVVKKKSITISARGTIGYCFFRKQPYVPIVRLIVIIPNNEVMTQYLYYYLDSSSIKGSGSVQSQLTVPDMEDLQILIPSNQIMQEFHEEVEIIDNSIELREQENEKLTELQSLLLARMGK